MRRAAARRSRHGDSAGVQGGLPFRYTSTGPVRARVLVNSIPGPTHQSIWNTYGRSAGRPIPTLVVWAHTATPGGRERSTSQRDGQYPRDGSRDRREARAGPAEADYRFATWDAEEWGSSGYGVCRGRFGASRVARWHTSTRMCPSGDRASAAAARPHCVPCCAMSQRHRRSSARKIYSVWRAASPVADTLEPAREIRAADRISRGSTTILHSASRLGIRRAGRVYHPRTTRSNGCRDRRSGFAGMRSAARVGAALALRLANGRAALRYAEFARRLGHVRRCSV